MHSFTLTPFSLFFSYSVPQGLGVSCNLSTGFSPAYPVTCSPSYLFLTSRFLIPFPCLTSHAHPAPSRSASLSLGWVSWTYYKRVCSMFVTGQLGRKEGRLMASEILSDSGPVQAVPMGSLCFLLLWNAKDYSVQLKIKYAIKTKSKQRTSFL